MSGNNSDAGKLYTVGLKQPNDGCDSMFEVTTIKVQITNRG